MKNKWESEEREMTPEELEKYEANREQFRVPLCCPACNQLFYNWDTKFWYKYGVCSDCTINYVEDRNLSGELLRNRKDLLEFVKQKISQKNKDSLPK